MAQIVDAHAGELRCFGDFGPRPFEVREVSAFPAWEQIVAFARNRLKQCKCLLIEGHMLDTLLLCVVAWLRPDAPRQIKIRPLGGESLTLAAAVSAA